MTASALASLNALAPGRIHFGVGTGFTARRTMGLRAITLARLEQYVRVVQGLLEGETIEWAAEGGSHKIRFLNPDAGLFNLKDPIRLHISAYGPKSHALVGRLGAAWKTFIADMPGALGAIEGMKQAWGAAGRASADLYATAWV